MRHDEDWRLVRDATRDKVAALLADGGGRPGEVADAILKKHNELISKMGLSLARDVVTRWARSDFKRWTCTGSANDQLVIPGLISDLLPDLPASISVPMDDGEAKYRPLLGKNGVTKDELKRGIAYLFEQIRCDTRKANALQRIYVIVDEAGASGDEIVDAVLAALSIQSGTQSKFGAASQELAP